MAQTPGFKLDQQAAASRRGFSGAVGNVLRDMPGTREVRDAAGALTALRVDVSPRGYEKHVLNAEIVRRVFDGRLTLTGQAQYSRHDEDTTLLTTSPAGEPVDDQVIAYLGTTHTYEGGVSFERGIRAWDLAFTALLTRRRSQSDVSSLDHLSASAADVVSTQFQARDGGESIARLVASRDFAAYRVETGVEGAFNTLDAQVELTEDRGARPAAIVVPNADVRVEEARGETFASYAWRPRGPRSMEARLSAETSRLSFAGDVRQSVDLVYWKPLLQIARAFGDNDELQLRMFRDVDQLDFNHFVAAASLADDVVNGGNPDRARSQLQCAAASHHSWRCHRSRGHGAGIRRWRTRSRASSARCPISRERGSKLNFARML